MPAIGEPSMLHTTRMRWGLGRAVVVLPLAAVSSMARQPAAVPYPADYRTGAFPERSILVDEDVFSAFRQ
jgi:hypothetical protein